MLSTGCRSARLGPSGHLQLTGDLASRLWRLEAGPPQISSSGAKAAIPIYNLDPFKALDANLSVVFETLSFF